MYCLMGIEPLLSSCFLKHKKTAYKLTHCRPLDFAVLVMTNVDIQKSRRAEAELHIDLHVSGKTGSTFV